MYGSGLVAPSVGFWIFLGLADGHGALSTKPAEALVLQRHNLNYASL